MNNLQPKFYKDRFCLNVLAKDFRNAEEIYKVSEGHVVVGVLSKNYPTTEVAVGEMNQYAKVIENAVSVGLGAGDPKQSNMVTDILRYYKPQHVNQVFTGVNGSRTAVENDETFINCLCSPSGEVGKVVISTGPESSEAENKAIVDVETAILMIKDMGGSSIKFYPMKGLETKDEFIAVCNACAKLGLGIEPTGGITKENFREICEIAYNAGVDKIIPHVYTSIIDESGETNTSDVTELYDIIKDIVE